MNCPKCKGKCRCVDSRDIKKVIADTSPRMFPCVNAAANADHTTGTARTHVCQSCGHRFHTIEKPL